MEPFKNAISPELVSLVGQLISRHVDGFDADRFCHNVVNDLESLELKARVARVADALDQALPKDWSTRGSILLSMLHPDVEGGSNSESTQEGLRGWGIWPLTHLVGCSGLGDLEGSLSLLREMTKRGTSEFDVRPFIVADPDKALNIISSWADDENLHVRRLVSEGTRPRLPWSIRLDVLVRDPSPMLPILKRLRDDPSDYVRRSVANHLNDIAKDHPNLVAETAKVWLKDASPDRKKLIRHACRTLIKQGHPKTLEAFGYEEPRVATPSLRILTPSVTLGGTLDFEVELSSNCTRGQRLIVDYVVDHVKANGTRSPKVFKWTTLELQPGASHSLTRSHPMKPITTRRYYAGEHALRLRINGRDFANEGFDLRLNH
ncbi:MAG: DNA alkylation repair protein [Pseudomonadota bacterium]